MKRRPGSIDPRELRFLLWRIVFADQGCCGKHAQQWFPVLCKTATQRYEGFIFLFFYCFEIHAKVGRNFTDRHAFPVTQEKDLLHFLRHGFDNLVDQCYGFGLDDGCQHRLHHLFMASRGLLVLIAQAAAAPEQIEAAIALTKDIRDICAGFTSNKGV